MPHTVPVLRVAYFAVLVVAAVVALAPILYVVWWIWASF